MKFRDVELLEKRDDIGAREKDLIRSGNALRLLGGRADAPRAAEARN